MHGEQGRDLEVGLKSSFPRHLGCVISPSLSGRSQHFAFIDWREPGNGANRLEVFSQRGFVVHCFVTLME